MPFDFALSDSVGAALPLSSHVPARVGLCEGRWHDAQFAYTSDAQRSVHREEPRLTRC
jgi:hypothetical protein